MKKHIKNNYAFIDSQNLNLGIQKVGWKLDWRKFRAHLADHCGVTKAFMFIGYMQENESLYEQMHDLGYLIVLKPVVIDSHNEEKDNDKPQDKPKIKGNIDADLVLYALKEMPNYEKAVIVSGDGDFYGLIEYLAQQKRLHKVLAPNWQYSSLLKEFENYIERLDLKRKELAYRDNKKSIKKKINAQTKQGV